MRKVLFALLYTAMAGVAIPAGAEGTGVSAANALRTGDMKKLTFHAAPKPVSAATFTDFAGSASLQLSDYRGKYVLLNFWATWCAPCRKEMPMLSELQADLGGDNFEVVTIATGRNPAPAMKKFFDEIGVENLPLHRDPKQALARDMAVFGLPITVILNPDGEEVARLRGDADWSSDAAKAILRALIANG
ncbi:MAG: TlpA family protein disulfide reductase [Rhodobacteraceae bacterium]|nr:TlpA family protein disulfide reductase [Paracoccaceae bacterium]